MPCIACAGHHVAHAIKAITQIRQFQQAKGKGTCGVLLYVRLAMQSVNSSSLCIMLFHWPHAVSLATYLGVQGSDPPLHIERFCADWKTLPSLMLRDMFQRLQG